MKIHVKNLLFLKSMFAKLLASFILVIIIQGVFQIYSYKAFTRIIETQIAQNIDERFDNLVAKFDRYFDQIKYILLQMSFDTSFNPVNTGKALSLYDQKIIVDSFRERIYKNNQNEYLNGVNAIFLVTASSSDYIVESHGTFKRDDFFLRSYKSPLYTEEFWLEEMKKDFTFSIYPSSLYKHNTMPESESYLMPIAFKIKDNNNYIMIALVDMRQVARSIEGVSSNNLYIYNQNEQCLFPSDITLDISNMNFSNGKRFFKTKEGYLFMRTSSQNNLRYYKLVSDKNLRKELQKVSHTYQIVLFISILASIIISLMIVTKFNNPVKQITEIIRSSKCSVPDGSNTLDLIQIRDNIQQLVNVNENYVQDISSKNSMLKTFFYQAKINDVYFNSNDIKDIFSIDHKYAIASFQVHYRDLFYQQINEGKSKATFILKELVDLYINTSFPGSITFQVENSRIISVINIDKSKEDFYNTIQDISKKLQPEEEFAFFTISISDVIDDVSQIQKVYDRLYEVGKARKPVDETQILSESIISGYPKRFFLSQEHVNSLSKVLSNGLKEECLKLVEDILYYNSKKSVTCFYMVLLCDEILKCCMQQLQKLQLELPDTIISSDIYKKLNGCITVKDYTELCREFIEACVDCVVAAKKDDDYIVGFVTRYVEEHYNEDIYLDIFSEKLGITSAYISTYFKSKMSISLMDYINNYKIQKAIELMVDPKLKLKDVAQRVGIENINTFIRLFKKYEGITPNEFRKQNQSISCL